MKRRLFALVLALCLTAMLSGCESVDDVEAAIDEIGTVTMESGSKIDSAKLKYDALSESSQAEVENADVLMDAIAEYDRLTAAVDTFIDAVGEIGFVTLDSGAAIDYAWESYEALYADDLTGYVKEYAAVLQQSEDGYGVLYTEDAYATAEEFSGWGDHRSADATLYAAVSRFPDAPDTPKCKDLGATCVSEMAHTDYLNGNLESAMDRLIYCEDIYGTNARYDEVRNLVEIALTQKRPNNGYVFRNSVGSAYGKFTVNASDSDACVKLELEGDPEKLILFYVRAGESATVYVPDGCYIVKYTTGEYWFGEESMFGQYGTFSQADDIFAFSTKQEGNTVYYDAITITLYSVVDGTLQVTDIPAGDF